MIESNLIVREDNNYIYTLGKFLIRQGDQVVTENTIRSKRMWEIFKFILSNRDKVFFPETILDSIWPERDYADPGTVMRAQMFRLKRALNNASGGQSLATNLVFAQGIYCWEDKVECWVDVDEFEDLADRAGSLPEANSEEKIDLHQRAIKLYKGEYLPESYFSEWVVPLRAYYHDLYLNCVFELADLLKRKHAYSDIIRLCEQASTIDYFEEKIHILLIEALLAEKQTTRARAVYNEITSAFYREMGIKPSTALKNLYRLIGVEEGNYELDLSTIQEGLKGKEVVKGAYYCDPGLFRYFYKMERLRSERSGQSNLLCLLTLTKADSTTPPSDVLRAVMQELQEMIMFSLRKGDLVTRWNDAQFLLMLPGLNKEQAFKVMDRIEKSFSAKHSLRGLTLHKKVETLLPLEGDVHFS